MCLTPTREPDISLILPTAQYSEYHIFSLIQTNVNLLLQEFPVKGLMEGDNQKSVLHLFRKPVVGNTVAIDFQHDVCSNEHYTFCIQMEVYGKYLGVYK